MVLVRIGLDDVVPLVKDLRLLHGPIFECTAPDRFGEPIREYHDHTLTTSARPCLCM